VDAFEAFLTPLTAAPEPQPFLAVLWFHTVHVPFTTLPEWRQLYEGDHTGGGFTQDEMDYFGDISAMDAAIGRLRALLRSQGVADDTIVAFSVRGPNPQIRCLAAWLLTVHKGLLLFHWTHPTAKVAARAFARAKGRHV